MVHSICLRFAENLAFSRIAPKNQMSVLFRVSKIFAAARMHRCQLLKCHKETQNISAVYKKHLQTKDDARNDIKR